MKELNSEPETFEIHITGNSNILNYLKNNNLGWLEIDMLDKELNVFSKDYMSSIVYKAKDFDYARQIASDLALNILPKNDVIVHRIKIESPPLDKYLDKAIYVESHWESSDKSVEYPLSYLVNKNKYVSTNREYKRSLFKDFIDSHIESEICLLDTNIGWDGKWFDLWK